MLRPGKRWYLPAVLALGAFAGGPLLVQLRILEPFHGFMMFALSGIFGVVSFLWGLRLLSFDRRQSAILVSAGVFPLFVIVLGLAGGRHFPRINDIATDLDNPPRLANGAPYPDDFKELVRTGYPDLISKPLAMPPAAAFAKVRDVAKAMPGWNVVATDEAAMTLSGTETSGIFRFVDDFTVRVEPIDGKAVVAMRSRSRDGKGDFGVNAARIRGFFAALDR